MHLIRSAALALTATLWLPAALAQSAQEQHVIKEDQARTGSKFKRNAVTSPIPMDRRYEDMTPEQQAAVKSVYEAMGPGDEPPFPEAGLLAIMREVNEATKIVGLRGRLRLHVRVDAEGKARAVALVESIDKALDLYVAGVLMRTKYKPAKCAGTPCAQEYLFLWNVTASLD